MATMTKNQATDAILKTLQPFKKNIEAGFDGIAKALPKLDKVYKPLQAAVKKAESGEMVDMLARAIKLPMRELALAAQNLSIGLKALKEATQDEDVLEALSQELIDAMRDGTTDLEKARNALRDAKVLVDEADVFLAQHASDNDSAAEEWSVALMNWDTLYSAAKEESKVWGSYEPLAKAALEARDAAGLDKIRKARPAAKNLDAIVALPKGKPFEAFDKEFDLDKLGSNLQDEISLDRGKAMNQYDKALALHLAKTGIAQRVDDMVIEARDGKKALKVLEMPPAALPRLQIAIDGMDSALPKALDALAKAHKLKATGKDMVAALKQAGVI